MFSLHPRRALGLPHAALMLVLASPAAAVVTIRLEAPKKILEPGEAFLFRAVVEGTQNTAVHWSACEVIKQEGTPRFFPLGLERRVKFEKDEGHGLARFSARPDATNLRFFQIRVASQKDPSAVAFATIAMKAGVLAAGAPDSYPGESRVSLVESKVVAPMETEARPWWYREAPEVHPYRLHEAFEMPFRLDAKDAPTFRPEGFGMVKGKPCLLGTTEDFRDCAGWKGMDNVLEPLIMAADEDFNALRFSRMTQLRDGSVVMVEEYGARIWRVVPGETPRILAGNGERGWNGVLDESNNPRLPHEVSFKRIVAVTALEDGTLAVADADGGRILRIIPDQRVEVLAGGGKGALTDQDLRQPQGQPRPALKLNLIGLTSLAPSRDGHLLFTGASMGVCRLSPDGVVHQITPNRSDRAVETSDGRVVYKDEDGNLQAVVPGGAPKLLVQGEPGHAFEGERGNVHPCMIVNKHTLGTIHNFFPVQGGGLLIHTTFEELDFQRIWYLAHPGKDGYWTQQIARMAIAIDAGRWAEAARIQKWVTTLATTDPAKVDHLDPRLFLRVSKKGLPKLSASLQRHIQGFLMDPFRAQVCLDHLTWHLSIRPEEFRESWAKYLAGRAAAPIASTLPEYFRRFIHREGGEEAMTESKRPSTVESKIETVGEPKRATTAVSEVETAGDSKGDFNASAGSGASAGKGTGAGPGAGTGVGAASAPDPDWLEEYPDPE